MRCIFIILFICAFASSLLCSAMDIVKEITTVKHPTSVAFLDDVRVIIGGDQCIIETLFNPNSVQKIDKTPIFHIAINKAQTRFAVSSEKQLAIYGFNGKRIWSQKPPLSQYATLAFDATSPVLFAYIPGRLTTYKYLEKTPQSHAIQSHFECPTAPISYHPTEQKLLYPSSESTLSIIGSDYDIKHTYHSHQQAVVSGMYSLNGNHIAIIYDHTGFSVHDLMMNFRYNIPITECSKKAITSAFHPHRPILAVLFDNNALQYWNYKTMKLLAARLHAIEKKDWFDCSCHTERLSFSPDGKKLIVAFKDQCIIFHVPCRDFFVTLYRLFKMHRFPLELIRSLIAICLRACKFHNYNLAELIKTWDHFVELT